MTRELVIQYSMYVIGKTESNHTWNSCPAFDGVSNIISIGMMQNAGSHAQDLLLIIKDKYPSEWGTITSGAPRLASDVENLPQNWDAWKNYSLTDREREVVSSVLGTDNGKLAQQEKWSNDANYYIDYGVSLGFTIDNPKPLIYFMSMYHQSPQSANVVVSQSSGNASLNYIHQVRANNSVLGRYSNRYNTTFSMLNDWDGVSAPPDFGQIGELTDENSQPPASERPPSEINYMLKIGQNYVIFGDGVYKNGLTMIPCTGDRFIPAINAEGSETTPDYNGGGNNPDADAILEWLRARLGQWGYSMGAGRDNSDVSKVADCSSTWWQAFWHVAGIDVGGYTGAMAQKGQELLRTRDPQDVMNFVPQMQKCDLILWSKISYAMPAGGAAHVVGYSGDGNCIETGGGNSSHPTEKPLANTSIIRGSGYYMVRRYL